MGQPGPSWVGWISAGLGGRRSWAGLLKLWSGATEYLNRMDYKWWSGVELLSRVTVLGVEYSETGP